MYILLTKVDGNLPMLLPIAGLGPMSSTLTAKPDGSTDIRFNKGYTDPWGYDRVTVKESFRSIQESLLAIGCEIGAPSLPSRRLTEREGL